MKESAAAKIAKAAHGKQEYGPGVPYWQHLEQVALILECFGVTDDDLKCAAWLHDVLEDTEQSPMGLLDAGVPVYVLALIDAVTDQPGHSREERKARTYPRIARIPDAVILKLADRIANVEACITKKDISRGTMYRKEQQAFHYALCDQSDSRSYPMWEYLASLIPQLPALPTSEASSEIDSEAAEPTGL